MGSTVGTFIEGFVAGNFHSRYYLKHDPSILDGLPTMC